MLDRLRGTKTRQWAPRRSSDMSDMSDTQERRQGTASRNLRQPGTPEHLRWEWFGLAVPQAKWQPAARWRYPIVWAKFLRGPRSPATARNGNCRELLLTPRHSSELRVTSTAESTQFHFATNRKNVSCPPRAEPPRSVFASLRHTG